VARDVTKGCSTGAIRPWLDSRALYYSDGLGGRPGNWLDRSARLGTGANPKDQIQHLAKVRVAGSNPVFRSIVAGQGRCFGPDPRPRLIAYGLEARDSTARSGTSSTANS
jgi:hypothetical protein